MPDVIIDMTMSLDGYVAGPGDGPAFPLGKHGGRSIPRKDQRRRWSACHTPPVPRHAVDHARAPARVVRTRVAASSRCAQEPRSADGQSGLAKRAEEGAQVLGEELRLLHRGEVAASRNLGETLDVVKALRPLARRVLGVLGKERESGGHVRPPTHSLAFSSIQRITDACVKS